MADNLMGLLPQPKPVYSYATGHTHQLHLKTPLKDPEEYTEWVQIIRGASENDRIELHLNTPGGDIYAAIELLHAFATTAAHIHVVCSGIVASAGTVLMTVGDSFEINPHTTFMFHNYSGGTMGKGNEMAIKIEYERQWSQKFMHDVYEGLLTADEINDLLDGRDYWLSADDVSERLEAMVEARYKKVEELQQEMEKALEEALQEVSEEPEVEEKPKRKRGRPRKVKTDE